MKLLGLDVASYLQGYGVGMAAGYFGTWLFTGTLVYPLIPAALGAVATGYLIDRKTDGEITLSELYGQI